MVAMRMRRPDCEVYRRHRKTRTYNRLSIRATTQPNIVLQHHAFCDCTSAETEAWARRVDHVLENPKIKFRGRTAM